MKNKIKTGEVAPWLWLNEGEYEAHDEKAGVALVRDYNNGGPAVFLPAVMEAAPELLAALERLETMLSAGSLIPATIETMAGWARAAIAKAKGGN